MQRLHIIHVDMHHGRWRHAERATTWERFASLAEHDKPIVAEQKFGMFGMQSYCSASLPMAYLEPEGL
jgi:hypothetical protein